MQYANDNDVVFLPEDYPPVSHPQSEPAAPLAAEGAHIAHAARGKTIHCIQHPFPILDR